MDMIVTNFVEIVLVAALGIAAAWGVLEDRRISRRAATPGFAGLSALLGRWRDEFGEAGGLGVVSDAAKQPARQTLRYGKVNVAFRQRAAASPGLLVVGGGRRGSGLEPDPRALWGKLTAADLRFVAGGQERLVGKLQQRYGLAKAEAEREVAAFFERKI